MNMVRITQFHDYHSTHAKMTEFAGYEMPLWYSTTTDEHMAVCNDSGIFDVSHMGRLLINGEAAASFIEGLVPTQVKKQPAGRAFYTLLLNDRAGIIDDLVILRLDETQLMLVVNAANATVDMEHLSSHDPPESVLIRDLTDSSAMIAVQGPTAQQTLQRFTDTDLSQLKRFHCSTADTFGQRSIISRTGYTGEDGFEVIILGASTDSPGKAVEFWKRLAEVSKPCGLGARDSLRLEAGFPLHGSDIDQRTDPLQADLAWVISSGKTDYVGSKALEELQSEPTEVIRRGVVVDEGIPRHGFNVLGASDEAGTVTSGTYSPVLRKGIALCRLKPAGTEPGAAVRVVIRGSVQRGHTVKTPFYDERIYGWKRQRNSK